MDELTCIVEKEGTGYQVLSPAVGYYAPFYGQGTHLGEGKAIGLLKIMNTEYNLILPPDIGGTISGCLDNAYMLNVEYRQELLQLVPFSMKPGDTSISSAATGTEDLPADKEEGFLITAFTTGIFYGRPGPDAPPFVTPGQAVEKGRNLGLIEVMKTFNHIVFQGTGTSNVGIIKKIYVQDAQEVKSGQPLFLIE